MDFIQKYKTGTLKLTEYVQVNDSKLSTHTFTSHSFKTPLGAGGKGQGGKILKVQKVINSKKKEMKISVHFWKTKQTSVN